MVQTCLDAVKDASRDHEFIRLAPSFRERRSDSIDYAVMEKTDRTALVPLDAGWSDVGTWDALFDAAERDEAENAVRGDVLLRDASRCYVRAESGMIALAGIEDIIVVSTKDATLVGKRGESNSVREVVQQLAANRRNEVEHHLTANRPWGGWMDSTPCATEFRVEFLTIVKADVAKFCELECADSKSGG